MEELSVSTKTICMKKKKKGESRSKMLEALTCPIESWLGRNRSLLGYLG